MLTHGTIQVVIRMPAAIVEGLADEVAVHHLVNDRNEPIGLAVRGNGRRQAGGSKTSVALPVTLCDDEEQLWVVSVDRPG